MLEEERKYDVGPKFTVPDLTDCLPAGGRMVAHPPQTLRATYFDTPDLRLARAGASLRFRRGDDEPWTVKLATGTPGIRHEICLPGSPTAVPRRLSELVLAQTRGARLAPVAVLSTVRRRYDLRSQDDQTLAELVDDAVSVLDGRRVRLKFREIEVERKAGKAKLLNRVETVLLSAGATQAGFTPKHVRALGPAATRPPDWPAPPAKLPSTATTGDVVSAALRRDIAQIVAHDPLVRLNAPVGKDDTAVHRMRVGVRRLRSDLRTFSAVLDTAWARHLRAELGWIAAALGAARDAEVLRARLRQTATADPLAPLDDACVTQIDAELAATHEEALARLDAALREERYRALLDDLAEAATSPRLTRRAARPAIEILPRLMRRPWHQFAVGSAGAVGAGDLTPDAPDHVWHAVRIHGKRARYASEAVAGVLGAPAAALARALGKVQNQLGEHQDAAIAAETWLAIAGRDPDDHALAVTAGRLFERERAAVHRARERFPRAWERASKRRLTAWLR